MVDPENYDLKTDDGKVETYVYDRMTYDSDGNVVKEMDAKGYLSGADDNSRCGTLYSYNLTGWLVEKKVPLKKENVGYL